MRPPNLREILIAAAVIIGLGLLWSMKDLPGFGGFLDEPDVWFAGSDPRPGEQAPRRLVLAVFSTPREMYEQDIIPAFERHWHQTQGEEIEVEASFRGSRAQARAIVAGFEADVAALAWEPDMQALVAGGLVEADWRDDGWGGMISSSYVIMATRSGHPLEIQRWEDLTRPDVELLLADPRSSGEGMWGLAALYGAALRGRAHVPPDDHEAAVAFVSQVLARVVVMDESAAESLETFAQGVGDVVITYQDELVAARLQGQSWVRVVPEASVLVEHPIAVVDDYAQRHGNQDLAEAFVRFTRQPVVQEQLKRRGYGPPPALDRAGPTFGPKRPDDLFTIEDLGGWAGATQLLLESGGVLEQFLGELGHLGLSTASEGSP